MPLVLKNLEGIAHWSFSRYVIALISLGVIFFGVVVISAATVMRWWEAAIIIVSMVVLVLALLWTCGEVRRMNR